MRRVSGIAVLLAGLLLAGEGAAQPASAAAAAKAKFEEGQAAAEKGDFQSARALFLSSKDLLATVGTLLNLADCEEHLGMVASARQHYLDAKTMMKAGDKRIGFADERARALEPRLPALRVDLTAEAPPGTVVRLDARELPASSLGTDMPLDPGDHAVVVSAPGRPDRSYGVKLVEKQRQALAVEPGAKPAAAASSTPAADIAPPQGAGGGGSTLRTLGFIAGGAGLIGLAFGTVTGVLAVQKKSEVEKACPAPPSCSSAGQAIAIEGKALGSLSTAGLATGIPLLAAGVVLVVVGSRGAPQVRAAIGPGGASLVVSGAF
jgi:hypothetical protein